MVLGALRSALSAKLRDGELKIVQGFTLGDHKTKAFRQVLDKLEVKRSVLLIEAAENRNLSLASRNLERVKLVPTKDLNVYDLLAHKQVLLSEPAARKLSEVLA
jgi:large subunit ribosomal protein L4